MRFVAAAVLAAVTTVLASGVSAQDVKDGKVVSKEGGFSATFPAGMKVQTKAMDVPGGMKMNMYIGDGGMDKKALIVMHLAFPPAVAKAMPADTLLDMIAKQSAAKAGGTEVSNKATTFGKEKYPAREVVLEKDEVRSNLTIILADPNLYVLTAVGSKAYLAGDEVKAFTKSFEIAPPAKATKKTPATAKAID